MLKFGMFPILLMAMREIKARPGWELEAGLPKTDNIIAATISSIETTEATVAVTALNAKTHSP